MHSRSAPYDWRLAEAATAIDMVASGTNADARESEVIDFKEDPSRRGLGGGDMQTGRRSDRAFAADLAQAAACLANHRGGTVIVGVADRPGGVAAFRGTDLDQEELRQRIHEITSPPLTVDVVEHQEPRSGKRLLLILAPEALAAVAVRGEHRHRVGTRCVVMTAEDHAARWGYRQDWSAGRSSLPTAEVDPRAVTAARAFLRATGDPDRAALAARDDRELLTVLAARDNGYLTETGALLFGRRPSHAPARVDYRRRVAPGAPSQQRLDAPGLPLLVELERLFATLDAHLATTTQVRLGTRATVPEIPTAAAREAIVNGVMHRDWRIPEPIEVEHEGAQLTVTSPGGFLPGVSATNVLTTPSRTRNAQLARAMRSLRLAESEGIGVDQMFREMVQLGHRPPEITETGNGLGVRCVLVGGPPVRPVVEVVSLLDEPARQDVDIALIGYALLQHPRVRAGRLQALLQKGPAQVEAAVQRALHSRVDLPEGTSELVLPVGGTGDAAGWVRFGDAVRDHLREVIPYLGLEPRQAGIWITALLADEPELRPRDLVELLGFTQAGASRALRYALEGGLVTLGSEQAVGRNVYYVRRSSTEL